MLVSLPRSQPTLPTLTIDCHLLLVLVDGLLEDWLGDGHSCGQSSVIGKAKRPFLLHLPALATNTSSLPKSATTWAIVFCTALASETSTGTDVISTQTGDGRHAPPLTLDLVGVYPDVARLCQLGALGYRRLVAEGHMIRQATMPHLPVHSPVVPQRNVGTCLCHCLGRSKPDSITGASDAYNLALHTELGQHIARRVWHRARLSCRRAVFNGHRHGACAYERSLWWGAGLRRTSSAPRLVPGLQNLLGQCGGPCAENKRASILGN